MQATTSPASPTLAQLRAECLALMATAAASGTLADAIAAHNAASRHDAVYYVHRAMGAVADAFIAAGSAPRD